MKKNLQPVAKANILIIDDSPENLSYFSTILQARNYKVRTATTTYQAAQLIDTIVPDLILLNIYLPDESGYDFCLRLENHEKTNNIPILFLVSDPLSLEKDQIFQRGMDYLVSPFHQEEALSRIETLLTLRDLKSQLRNQITALRTLTMRLQTELAFARRIQQKLLLPVTPNWKEIDLVCYTRSAREVGGDFYIYHAFNTGFRFNTKRFAIGIGDVSGKGMPAALLMAISLASFDTIINQTYTTGKLITDLISDSYPLNALFNDLDRAIAPYTSSTEQNCALIYIELTKHVRTNRPIEMRCANAGCTMPFVRRSDGEIEWVKAYGLPLGVGLRVEFGYEEVTMDLNPGDMVILTSDGVIEAKNELNEQFGFGRLEETIATIPDNKPDIALNHIREAVDRFLGEMEPNDDMTIVVVQV